MADPTQLLERRCRLLLAAYPPGYRALRGEEIVATLLDTAGPGRRSPRLGDAVDVIASGLRRRLGTDAMAGLSPGLTLAAPVALALAAGISAFAWWRVEPLSSGAYLGGPPLFGAFRTVGPVGYAAWLVAAVGRAVLPPRVGRGLIALALAATLALPVMGVATGVDRPPLWVLMGLSVFGALALAGTSTAAGARMRPSTDERVSVVLGAVAVALATSTVMLAWPPARGGFGYYYQPTIARVGVVVAVTVAAVAGIATIRLLRGRGGRDWLWAAALLGLPAGWLGPFDTARLRFAGDTPVAHFGRLAQVMLASCVAAAAIAWLASARPPGSRPSPQPSPRSSPLPTAGALALGAGLGGLSLLVLTATGLVGFTGSPLRDGVPPHVVASVAVVLLAAAVALIAGPRPRHFLRQVGVATVAGLLAAWLVASYDNGWSLGAWSDYAHTASLVMTLAFIPLTMCVLAAAATLRQARRWPAFAVLALSLGWMGYVCLPYVLSWGPAVLVLLACVPALALAGRDSAPAPGSGRMGAW